MSHWAELDKDNKVIRVLVGSNEEADEGQALVESLGGQWVKTSYNGTIRKNFAGVGYSYNEKLDAFIAPQCHEEATLNTKTYKWDCTNSSHKQ